MVEFPGETRQIPPTRESGRRDPLPLWASREVSLPSLSLRERFPVPYSALRELVRGYNHLRGVDTSPDGWLDAQFARIPRHQADIALPMIASVVAHAGDPEIPVITPTKHDVQAMNPWASMAPRRFIEKFAGNKLHKYGGKVVEAIEAVGDIPDPRRQFVQEILQLYRHVVSPNPWTEGGIFGGEVYKAEDKIADAVDRLLYRVKDGNSDELFTKKNYPLLTRLLPILPLPKDITDKVNAKRISVAGAEILSGIESFLRNEGIHDIPQSPRASHTIVRGLAESFQSGKLQKVGNVLSRMLWDAKNMLPVSGKGFKDLCYGYARDIVAATAQGKSSADVTAAVLVR